MPMVSQDDNLVSYRQAAEMLGVTVRTVHRLRGAGKLTPIVEQTERHAVTVSFRRSDVEALLQRGAA